MNDDGSIFYSERLNIAHDIEHFLIIVIEFLVITTKSRKERRDKNNGKEIPFNPEAAPKTFKCLELLIHSLWFIHGLYGYPVNEMEHRDHQYQLRGKCENQTCECTSYQANEKLHECSGCKHHRSSHTKKCHVRKNCECKLTFQYEQDMDKCELCGHSKDEHVSKSDQSRGEFMDPECKCSGYLAKDELRICSGCRHEWSQHKDMKCRKQMRCKCRKLQYEQDIELCELCKHSQDEHVSKSDIDPHLVKNMVKKDVKNKDGETFGHFCTFVENDDYWTFKTFKLETLPREPAHIFLELKQILFGVSLGVHTYVRPLFLYTKLVQLRQMVADADTSLDNIKAYEKGPLKEETESSTTYLHPNYNQEKEPCDSCRLFFKGEKPSTNISSREKKEKKRTGKERKSNIFGNCAEFDVIKPGIKLDQLLSKCPDWEQFTVGCQAHYEAFNTHFRDQSLNRKDDQLEEYRNTRKSSNVLRYNTNGDLAIS